MPDDCVEVFEARVVQYFDPDGVAIIDWDVNKPDGSDHADVPIHEVLGVMLFGMIDAMIDRKIENGELLRPE